MSLSMNLFNLMAIYENYEEIVSTNLSKRYNLFVKIALFHNLGLRLNMTYFLF